MSATSCPNHQEQVLAVGLSPPALSLLEEKRPDPAQPLVEAVRLAKLQSSASVRAPGSRRGLSMLQTPSYY